MFNGLTSSFALQNSGRQITGGNLSYIYMGVKECSWTNKNEKKSKKINKN